MIIPGDMGRASWVLVGQPGSMEQTFGTTCHGAGRADEPHGRGPARRTAGASTRSWTRSGIIARAQSRKGLAEEQPAAYKDVDHVVDVVARRRAVEEGGADAADRRDQGVTIQPPPPPSCFWIFSRLKEPGVWLGGYSFMDIRNFAAMPWIGTMMNGRSRNQSL